MSNENTWKCMCVDVTVHVVVWIVKSEFRITPGAEWTLFHYSALSFLFLFGHKSNIFDECLTDQGKSTHAGECTRSFIIVGNLLSWLLKRPCRNAALVLTLGLSGPAQSLWGVWAAQEKHVHKRIGRTECGVCKLAHAHAHKKGWTGRQDMRQFVCIDRWQSQRQAHLSIAYVWVWSLRSLSWPLDLHCTSGLVCKSQYV